MNEPKLSAEMEKRFDEEFDHFVIDVGESGETVDWDRVKQFLATALEEQRKQILSEVEGWIENNEYSRPDHIEGFAGIVDTDDLQDKLNQLKGEK